MHFLHFPSFLCSSKHYNMRIFFVFIEIQKLILVRFSNFYFLCWYWLFCVNIFVSIIILSCYAYHIDLSLLFYLKFHLQNNPSKFLENRHVSAQFLLLSQHFPLASVPFQFPFLACSIQNIRIRRAQSQHSPLSKAHAFPFLLCFVFFPSFSALFPSLCLSASAFLPASSNKKACDFRRVRIQILGLLTRRVSKNFPQN